MLKITKLYSAEVLAMKVSKTVELAKTHCWLEKWRFTRYTPPFSLQGIIKRLIYTRELRVATRNQWQRSIYARQDFKLRPRCIWAHDYESQQNFHPGADRRTEVNCKSSTVLVIRSNRVVTGRRRSVLPTRSSG